MLKPRQAVEQARRMIEWRSVEHGRLARVLDYLRGRQALQVVPHGVPNEVRRLAAMARVNVLGLVVDSVAQSLYVDGYRAAGAAEDAAAWAVWQANRLDARQAGVHRAALAYGAAYTVVLPGDPQPVIRGVSPRRMTAVYGEDVYPMWALEATPQPAGWLYRLYDDQAVHHLAGDSSGGDVTWLEHREHPMGVCPVARFVNVEDLDGEVVGEVEPLMALQDQIDFTTFGLLVAQHYGAFRQRYVIGWLARSEEERLKASASQLWTFEDPGDGEGAVKVGEFAQTDLGGYIESREASLRHLASVSQTPAHELLGRLVNLSAEALVAADAARDRKVTERETAFGESWEQTLALASVASGSQVDAGAQVRWRDTAARSFAATVDALGKLAQMLGVPPEELWERVPGVTQQDVERWRASRDQGDAVGQLAAVLDRQAAAPADAGEVKAKADAMGVLIRPASDQSAARQVGLSDIDFTGAVPVSLRLPESDARGLEQQ